MAEDRKTISLRLPKPLVIAVDKAALVAGRNRHDWLVDAVERGLDGPVETDAGPIERKTRADVEAIVSAHPMGEALAEVCFSLARSLDQGAGQLTAAIARELRATLIELAKYEHGSAEDDDDAPDLGAPSLGDRSDEDEADSW